MRAPRRTSAGRTATTAWTSSCVTSPPAPRLWSRAMRAPSRPTVRRRSAASAPTAPRLSSGPRPRTSVRSIRTPSTPRTSTSATSSPGPPPSSRPTPPGPIGTASTRYNGRMSADGTKVVWEHLGRALYVYDLTSGATTLVTVDAEGTGGANGRVGDGWISSDGTRSPSPRRHPTSARMTPTATSTSTSGTLPFRRRRWSRPPPTVPTAATHRRSPTGGAPTDRRCSSARSHPTSARSIQTASRTCTVRDLDTETTTLVSVHGDGTDSGNASSMRPTLSADGTRVAFESTANDLGHDDTAMCRRGTGFPGGYYDESCTDICVRDLGSGHHHLGLGSNRRPRQRQLRLDVADLRAGGPPARLSEQGLRPGRRRHQWAPGLLPGHPAALTHGRHAVEARCAAGRSRETGPGHGRRPRDLRRSASPRGESNS